MDKKVYCSTCEQKQHYLIKQEALTRKVKDNTYTLDVQVAHCAVCDEEVYIPEISDHTQQSFFNAYRLDHQLVTVDELIRIRKNLSLNQRDFSRLLGFGEITISRYELGSLPSKNNSQAIKKISDKKYLEEKYEQNNVLISNDGRNTIEDYLNA